jgi:DNA-binding MarR family transcriptional regulator
MKTLNSIFGPSLFLLVLDLFLQNPEEYMNLREISRRINKKPGSVSRALPRLVDRNYVTATRIGAKIIAYKLNKEEKIIQHLLEFQEKLRKNHQVETLTA